MDKKVPNKKSAKLHNFFIRVMTGFMISANKRQQFRDKHMIIPEFIDNYIYIIDNDGNKKRVFTKINNLDWRFTGKNNILELPDSEFHAFFNIQEDNSYIKIGKNFSSNEVNFRILEGNSKVIIGDNCMFSCSIDIFNSDAHVIMKKGEKIPYNQPKPVIIGNHVWVGYNVTILKGTEIAYNTIVGACAVVSGKFKEPNTVIAGNPAQIVKHDIEWDSRPHTIYNETLKEISTVTGD